MKHIATAAAAAAVAALAFLCYYAHTINQAYTTVLQLLEGTL